MRMNSADQQVVAIPATEGSETECSSECNEKVSCDFPNE